MHATSRLLSLILVASLLVAPGCAKREVVVTLTRGEIQEWVEPRFPVSKLAYLVLVTLRDPKVVLPDGTDRIGIELNVDVKIPLLAALSGKIAASGTPRYEGGTKAFYLERPSVERVEINGLKPEHEPKARAAIEKLATELLATRPIYELKGRNLKEVTASYVLRDVLIRDGKLQATLALP